MCTISTYLRSLRGVIPLIALPGNASALLLIVPRKHNFKVKKKKKKERQPEKQILSCFFFFQSKLGITFYSVSSVKIYSPSESLSQNSGVPVTEKRNWTSLTGGCFIFQWNC